MDWIEWLLSRDVRQFLLHNDLYFPLLFVARLIGVTVLECAHPTRKIPYRSVLWLDILGAIILVYVTVPAADYLRDFIAIRPALPKWILTLPPVATFILYYIVGDFGAYWMHRFWHLRTIWPIHRWHHSPTSMYWLAGYRASLLQLTLQGLPWAFAYSVFGLAPWWMYLAVTTSHILLNDWMHMNITWRSNWLEWVMVTPRTHHIHHSDDLALSNANFGVTFSIWDRMFGTFVDPEQLTKPISFGIKEQIPLPRLALGV
jgi:sterol desaturase/sphingolipid hydroxylase (fatty acid hydroxylase superfamily)